MDIGEEQEIIEFEPLEIPEDAPVETPIEEPAGV